MDYNYERLYRMAEDNIEELPETTAAEQNISRLLDTLKEKDPELFFAALR